MHAAKPDSEKSTPEVITMLEAKYQKALEKDKEFNVLKDIRQAINKLQIQYEQSLQKKKVKKF